MLILLLVNVGLVFPGDERGDGPGLTPIPGKSHRHRPFTFPGTGRPDLEGSRPARRPRLRLAASSPKGKKRRGQPLGMSWTWRRRFGLFRILPRVEPCEERTPGTSLFWGAGVAAIAARPASPPTPGILRPPSR